MDSLSDILLGQRKAYIGAPLEEEQRRLLNAGIPAQNQQTVLQNTGLGLLNQFNDKTMADMVSKTNSDALMATLRIPVSQNAATEATFGEAALKNTPIYKQLMDGAGGQPQQAAQPPAQTSFGVLQSDQNPAPRSVTDILLNKGQGQQPQGQGQGQKSLYDMSLPDLYKYEFDNSAAMNNPNIAGPVKLAKAQRLLEIKDQTDKDLNTQEWKAKIASIGDNANMGAQVFNEFKATHPYFNQLSEADAKSIRSDSFTAKAPLNMAGMQMGLQKLSPKNLDYLVNQLHNRSMSMEEIKSQSGRMMGLSPIDAEREVHDEYAKRYGEEYDVSAGERGRAMSKNIGLSSYVSAIDNAYKTFAHLKDAVAAVHNGDFTTFNKFKQALMGSMSDVNQARLNAVKMTAEEEGGGAVARGSSTVTDKARGMVEALTPTTMSDPATIAALDEAMKGMDRNRQALQDESYGFIKPRKVGGSESYQTNNYSPNIVAGAKAYMALPANQHTPANDAHAKKVLGL